MDGNLMQTQTLRRLLAASLALGVVGASMVVQAGDMAADGQDAFDENCSVCHSVIAGKIKVGPPLAGVVGRPAASVAGYPYSEAMKSSGVTWTPETLEAYLAGPMRMIPGIKMSFPGEPDAKVRLALVEYLKTVK